MSNIFCANCQEETEHDFAKSTYSGEYISECKVCGRNLKFPAGISQEELNKLIAIHKEDNQGQRPVKPAEIGPADVIEAPVTEEALGPRMQENMTEQEKAAWNTFNGSPENANTQL
jgi:hypothetical protein